MRSYNDGLSPKKVRSRVKLKLLSQQIRKLLQTKHEQEILRLKSEHLKQKTTYKTDLTGHLEVSLRK